ncbi:Gfo/Idh/MocA family protein [Natronolimnobius baerhuensis]|uniref:Oxidoreductase n=1 Tax=Natronolimnobius baerhuensis TaxID=253108 RepID=A0A202EBI8_9EURY|nr:Gfo/Idh/MocA family oxidoreductase [Natronolimnobius baerhuensis]OVE85602.1 hypothetical protein B2G88_01895 [Natronolimnobius baerhuensis]
MTLSVGLIGAGGIGKTHATNIEAHPDATLRAVCDLERDRAESVVEATGSEAAVYTDYRDALSEVALDAVYITIPPQSRVDVIRDVAAAGAAIFCEKPLATTLEDGREIVDIVSEAEIPFMMGFCLRFATPLQDLRSLVADGAVGDPICLFSTRRGWGVPDGDNWRTNPEQACGITIESTSHNIDLLRWLGGDIETAGGATTNVTHPELEAFDDTMVAHVTFENGAIGTILNSWTAHVETFRHGVIGTEGTAVVSGDGWWQLDRLEYARGAESTMTEYDDAVATAMGYQGETDAFLESVAAGTVPPVGLEDGLRALEVSHDILE